MRKRKYRKRRKAGRGKPYVRKNKVYFGGRRPYLRKNKVYFGEGIQRRNGIKKNVAKNPLVGQIGKTALKKP